MWSIYRALNRPHIIFYFAVHFPFPLCIYLYTSLYTSVYVHERRCICLFQDLCVLETKLSLISTGNWLFNHCLPDQNLVCVCVWVCVFQDQRLKEISMQTPPSASPSSQSIGSANNNHITQTPELFNSTLSANRCTQTRTDTHIHIEFLQVRSGVFSFIAITWSPEQGVVYVV